MSRFRRPIWPGHATIPEAIRFLASCCDGAVRLDGYGFSRDHVVIGHWLADTDPAHWPPAAWRDARALIRCYRRQLASAGFDVARVLAGRRAPRVAARIAAKLDPRWAPDPTAVHGLRWHNGCRWTEWVLGSGAPILGQPTQARRVGR